MGSDTRMGLLYEAQVDRKKGVAESKATPGPQLGRNWVSRVRTGVVSFSNLEGESPSSIAPWAIAVQDVTFQGAQR